MIGLQVFQVSQPTSAGPGKRGTQVLPQLKPVAFRNRHEDFYNSWIELRFGATPNFLACVRHGQGFSIGSVADHRVQGISNRENARTKRNLFPLEAARITGAVIKFLVRQNDLCRVAQKRDTSQHLIPDIAVRAHDLFLVIIEGARLTQD